MSSIHQEVSFEGVVPTRVYAALTQDEMHAAFTGAPSTIDATPGGTFSCHGGAIVGRHIELVPGERIVWAWRVAAWPEGTYSIVRLDLKADGDNTRLAMHHVGFPAEQAAHLEAGWHQRYWQPLAKYLQ